MLTAPMFTAANLPAVRAGSYSAMNAPAALAAYAGAAMADDPEYAAEVLEMARRAAKHPGRKKPD